MPPRRRQPYRAESSCRELRRRAPSVSARGPAPVPPPAGSAFGADERPLRAEWRIFRHGPLIHSDSMSPVPFPSGRPGVVRRDLSSRDAGAAAAWPAIASGRHALIAAPTGSGKTLAAFLAAIDALVREGVEGRLEDATRVVYVSPLKALSNDIQRNLEQPLAGIGAQLTRLGMPRVRDPRPGAHRRHLADRARGDAPAAAAHPRDHAGVALPAAHQRVRPRDAVDRAHGDRRRDPRGRADQARRAPGADARAAGRASAAQPMQRIGLSATQKPIEEIARFLTGSRPGVACEIVDSGHVRERDLNLVMPGAPLEAVMSGEVWATVYDQLASAHRGASHHADLREYAAHGGARLAAPRRAPRRGKRRRAPRQPREGDRASTPSSVSRRASSRSMVATASLELGIDIGDVELVCQLGIAALASRCSCSASAAPTTRSAACRRAAFSRRAATSWSIRSRCSTPCAAASSIGCSIPDAPARRALAADRGRGGGARIRRGRAVRARARAHAVPQPRRARTSTPWCACSPRASAPSAGGAAPICTATR